MSTFEQIEVAVTPELTKQLAKERFLPLSEVKHRTGLGKSTIYNMILQSNFPKQINITPRRVGWLESEIDKWINSRAFSLCSNSLGGN